MRKMKPVTLGLLLLCCLLPLCLSVGGQEDDLVFDEVIEETPTSSADPEQEQQRPRQQQPSIDKKSKKCKKWRCVERLLGIPSTLATVGHVFKLHVPKQAFSGDIDYYEVSSRFI